MKLTSDTSFLCGECTGSGCKLCSNTGYYYGHELFKMISASCATPEQIGKLASNIEDIIHKKDREISELTSALNISLALTKGLKNRLDKLTPDRVIESAKQDKLI